MAGLRFWIYLSSVVLFLAEMLINSPRKLFIFITYKVFSRSRYPINIMFNFENRSTAYGTSLVLILYVSERVLAIAVFVLDTFLVFFTHLSAYFPGNHVEQVFWMVFPYVTCVSNRCFQMLAIEFASPLVWSTQTCMVCSSHTVIFGKYSNKSVFHNWFMEGSRMFLWTDFTSDAVLAEISLRSPRSDCLFLLSKNIFIGSKYPQKCWINFEKNFTGLNATMCARARCFKCSLCMKHRTSFGEASCL